MGPSLSNKFNVSWSAWRYAAAGKTERRRVRCCQPSGATRFHGVHHHQQTAPRTHCRLGDAGPGHPDEALQAVEVGEHKQNVPAPPLNWPCCLPSSRVAVGCRRVKPQERVAGRRSSAICGFPHDHGEGEERIDELV